MSPVKISLLNYKSLPPELKQELDLLQDFLEVQPADVIKDQTLWLSFENEQLALVDHVLGALVVDFESYLKKNIRGKKELMAKAIGDSKKINKVLDVTLGLAEDAFFLVKLGYHVTGFEKSPLIYLLLKDAQRRLKEPQPLKIYFMDSHGYLKNSLSPAWLKVQSQQSLELDRVDAIYFDPMFENTEKKSALPRKEMQIFRKHISTDAEAAELLKSCLGFSVKRVVLKRPLKAAQLLEHPNHSFKGTTIRYDLYLKPNIS